MRTKTTAFDLFIDTNKIILSDQIIPLEDGGQAYGFAIKSTTDEMPFAYSYGNGITNTSEKKRDLISTLLSTDDSLVTIKNYIKTNGFFLNCNNGFETYDLEPIVDTKNIISNITILLCEINSNNPDYDVMLTSLKKLAGTHQIRLKGELLSAGFIGNNAKASSFYINPLDLSDYLTCCSAGPLEYLNHLNSEAYSDSAFEDYIVGIQYTATNNREDFVLDAPKEISDFPDYSEYIEEHYNYLSIPFSKYIQFLYSYSDIGVNKLTNDIFSFFYHLSKAHEDKEESFNIDVLSSNDMNSLLKEKLIDLCKRICYTYINEGIKTIYPQISSDTGKHAFVIPNLISAIFYNLYRFDFAKFTYCQCAKPGCNNYFIKSKTGGNNLYCCTSHARSEAQAALRKRQKLTNNQ